MDSSKAGSSGAAQAAQADTPPSQKEPLLNEMTSTLKSTQDFWQSVTPSYTLQLCSFSWCTAVSKFGFLDSVLRPRPKETKFVFGGTLTDVGRG